MNNDNTWSGMVMPNRFFQVLILIMVQALCQSFSYTILSLHNKSHWEESHLIFLLFIEKASGNILKAKQVVNSQAWIKIRNCASSSYSVSTLHTHWID